VHHGGGVGAVATAAFNRELVVNRAYLFRKNFAPTPLARAQFALMFALLLAHRAVNREWDGARGLLQGAREAWRSSLPADPQQLEPEPPGAVPGRSG
jgi:hypothetical protein